MHGCYPHAYIEELVEPVALADTTLEVVRIQRDLDGHVVLATTQKLPNLRFNLGELLLEAASGGVTAAGAWGQPARLAVAALRFLRAVRKLSTLDIRREDAETLITLYRLSQEKKLVRVDDLLAAAPPGRDEAWTARSLERLERLGCIELRMDGIVLHETIIVQRQD